MKGFSLKKPERAWSKAGPCLKRSDGQRSDRGGAGGSDTGKPAGGQAAEKFTQIDLSQNGVYSIGEDTKQLLAGVEQDVTFLLSGADRPGAEERRRFWTAMPASKHVRWEQKDPALYPPLPHSTARRTPPRQHYCGVRGAQQGDRCGELYQYDYSNYYTTGSADMLFDGEQQLTSALYYVTNGDLPVVYQLSGHGRRPAFLQPGKRAERPEH